jgi:hypothetical protein
MFFAITVFFSGCSGSNSTAQQSGEFPVLTEGESCDLAFVFFGFSVDIHVALRIDAYKTYADISPYYLDYPDISITYLKALEKNLK